MKVIYFILFVILAYASEKKEIHFATTVESSPHFHLLLEDLIVEDQKVPTDLLNLELPFRTTAIKKEELLEWMKSKRETQRELNSFTFMIPEKIELKWESPLSRNQFIRRAKNRLMQKCEECDFRLNLSNIPQLQGDQNRIEWRDFPLSGPFMVPVVAPDGKNVGWMSGQIKTERPVVKTTRSLRSGDTLTLEDLKVDKMDISFNKDYFSDRDQVIGKKVSRTLGPQTVLSSSDLQRSYQVRQGQAVRLISGNEQFEISAHGIAQDSGVNGDLIRIRLNENQKMISGRIVDFGMVRVE